MKLQFPLITGSWLDLRFELPTSNDLMLTTVQVKHVIKENNSFLTGVQLVDAGKISIDDLMGHLHKTYTPDEL